MFGRQARGPVVALREVWTSDKKLPKTVVQHNNYGGDQDQNGDSPGADGRAGKDSQEEVQEGEDAMRRTVHHNLLKRFIAEVNSVAVVTADGDLDGEGQLELGDQLATPQQNQTNRWDQAVQGDNLTQTQKQGLKKELEAFGETFSDKRGLTDKAIFSIPTGESGCLVPLPCAPQMETEVG